MVPVLNNAISGVDQALWDIKGRQAGMPVYELLGGKCREAAACYTHAAGAEIQQTIDQARQFMEQGFRHVRVQVGVPGMAGYGAARGEAAMNGLRATGPVFEPAPLHPPRPEAVRRVPQAAWRRSRAAARRA